MFVQGTRHQFLARARLAGDHDRDVALAQAANGAEAIQVHEELKPDIMIIDLGLPVLSGVEAIRAIRDASPDARILVLSNFEGDEDIHASFDAGASGYILKHNSGEQIVPAIRALTEGKQWIPAEIARQLKARKFVETLTLRERAERLSGSSPMNLASITPPRRRW